MFKEENLHPIANQVWQPYIGQDLDELQFSAAPVVWMGKHYLHCWQPLENQWQRALMHISDTNTSKSQSWSEGGIKGNEKDNEEV